MYPARVGDGHRGRGVERGGLVWRCDRAAGRSIGAGGELPALTKFVISLSHFCSDYALYIIGVVVVVIAILSFLGLR